MLDRHSVPRVRACPLGRPVQLELFHDVDDLVVSLMGQHGHLYGGNLLGYHLNAYCIILI